MKVRYEYDFSSSECKLVVDFDCGDMFVSQRVNVPGLLYLQKSYNAYLFIYLFIYFLFFFICLFIYYRSTFNV